MHHLIALLLRSPGKLDVSSAAGPLSLTVIGGFFYSTHFSHIVFCPIYPDSGQIWKLSHGSWDETGDDERIQDYVPSL